MPNQNSRSASMKAGNCSRKLTSEENSASSNSDQSNYYKYKQIREKVLKRITNVDYILEQIQLDEAVQFIAMKVDETKSSVDLKDNIISSNDANSSEKSQISKTFQIAEVKVAEVILNSN